MGTIVSSYSPAPSQLEREESRSPDVGQCVATPQTSSVPHSAPRRSKECSVALHPLQLEPERSDAPRMAWPDQDVDSETGDVVPREDTARGYEVAKGQYLLVEDAEFESIQIESTRTIDIDQFVPKNEIDERCIDSPYYIAPDGQVGQDAFAVIRDTIAKMNMVGLNRVVLTRREHVIALEPKGRGLLGMTLRYPYEVRDEVSYFEDIPELKLSKEMLDLASHMVNTKSVS